MERKNETSLCLILIFFSAMVIIGLRLYAHFSLNKKIAQVKNQMALAQNKGINISEKNMKNIYQFQKIKKENEFLLKNIISIGNIVPKNIFLKKMSRDKEILLLEGYAKHPQQVTDFVTHLSKLNSLNDISFKILQSHKSNDNPLSHFSITFNMKKNEH